MNIIPERDVPDQLRENVQHSDQKVRDREVIHQPVHPRRWPSPQLTHEGDEDEGVAEAGHEEDDGLHGHLGLGQVLVAAGWCRGLSRVQAHLRIWQREIRDGLICV